MKHLILTVVGLALTISSCRNLNDHSITVTPEFIQKEVGRGKQYCLVLLKRGPSAATIDSVALEKNQVEHLQHLFTLKSEGKLPLFGPLFEDSDLRGMCIFDLTNKEEVKKLLDADPHIRSGRLSYEIYKWFGLPGDKLP
ncbi:MAG TPA: hypothetical protein DGH68_11865 [Bacteroidetes bacterium]|nr:hypothetical protein [Bacteroidota bacterium]